MSKISMSLSQFPILYRADHAFLVTGTTPGGESSAPAIPRWGARSKRETATGEPSLFLVRLDALDSSTEVFLLCVRDGSTCVTKLRCRQRIWADTVLRRNPRIHVYVRMRLRVHVPCKCRIKPRKYGHYPAAPLLIICQRPLPTRPVCVLTAPV
jgi:hypothetical protein